MQILASVGGASQLPIPTLSAFAYGSAGTFTFTITNYDAANGYTLATTAGTIARSTNTVTVSGLANGQAATASVTATRAGFANSPTATRDGSAMPACASCGGAVTSTEGCNGATCGIIACGSGFCPAYNITSYTSNSPVPCAGCSPSVGGWYCCACGGACG
jgi:hypothetical protein